MSSAKIEMEKFDRSIVYNMWKERLLANLDLLGLIDALTSQENEVKRKEALLMDTKGKGEVSDSDPSKEKAVDPVLVEKQQKVRSTIIMYVTYKILRKINKEKTAVGMHSILDYNTCQDICQIRCI